jgi:hypothetical protein
MHLNQVHDHHGERTTRLHVTKWWSMATILVVGLAGLIHLRLVREHFEEQFVYGLVFTALALFQLTLALLLAVRPGPRVYRVGIWGSGLIVLVYVATRLIPSWGEWAGGGRRAGDRRNWPGTGCRAAPRRRAARARNVP